MRLANRPSLPRPLALQWAAPLAPRVTTPFLASVTLLLGLGAAAPVLAQAIANPQTSPGPRGQGCPPAIAPLVDQLLADLPSYANRAIQRQHGGGAPARLYVMVAGAAEIEPWPTTEPAIGPTAGPAAFPASALPPVPAPPGQAAAPARYQVFFTTLERQYSPPQDLAAAAPSRQSQSLQQFHWLILSRPEAAALPPWQLLSLRSQLAPYPQAERDNSSIAPLLSPPRDSRRGAIAQAIELWLRDCSAP